MKSKISSMVSVGIQSEEMTSMNSHLLSEFSIEELEARMETDPLMLSQIFGVTVNDDSSEAEPLCVCRKMESCGEYSYSCTHSPCSPIVNV